MEQPVLDVRILGQRFAKALMRASGTGREIDIRGKRYRVHHERVLSVVQMVVTATTGDVQTRFEAPEDLLIEHITGRSSDADGLAGFRLGWTDTSDQITSFFKANSGATLTYPVASTVITDAGTSKAGLDAWDVAILKNDKRTFVAQYVSGSVPFTADITLHMRRLIPV